MNSRKKDRTCEDLGERRFFRSRKKPLKCSKNRVPARPHRITNSESTRCPAFSPVADRLKAALISATCLTWKRLPIRVPRLLAGILRRGVSTSVEDRLYNRALSQFRDRVTLLPQAFQQRLETTTTQLLTSRCDACWQYASNSLIN